MYAELWKLFFIFLLFCLYLNSDFWFSIFVKKIITRIRITNPNPNMGANFSTHALPDCTPAELRTLYGKLIDQLHSEYGTRGYSGTFKENQGVDITGSTFATDDLAHDYLDAHCVKWEAVKAVRVSAYTDNRGKEIPAHWFLGGLCSC